MVTLYQLTYTMQPLPKVDHVNLAAVFFNREKFANEHVMIGKSHNCK